MIKVIRVIKAVDIEIAVSSTYQVTRYINHFRTRLTSSSSSDHVMLETTHNNQAQTLDVI